MAGRRATFSIDAQQRADIYREVGQAFLHMADTLDPPGSGPVATADSRLSAVAEGTRGPGGGWCEHACCACPDNPDHMHLFEASECVDCRTLESLEARMDAYERVHRPSGGDLT